MLFLCLFFQILVLFQRSLVGTVCTCPSVHLSVCALVRLYKCPSVHLSVCALVRLSFAGIVTVATSAAHVATPQAPNHTHYNLVLRLCRHVTCLGAQSCEHSVCSGVPETPQHVHEYLAISCGTVLQCVFGYVSCALCITVFCNAN